MNKTYLVIIGWLVRCLFLYGLGVLGSKYPAIYNSVNILIHSLNGQEAVIISITGAIAVAVWSIGIKLRDLLHLRVALKLQKNATLADVKVAAATQSVFSVVNNPPK